MLPADLTIYCNSLFFKNFLCYLQKPILRKHDKFLIYYVFPQICDGSDDKIQVIVLAPNTEQNHCLEVDGEGCNS